MASITKHGFLSALAGLALMTGCASIASAETCGSSAILSGAKAGAVISQCQSGGGQDAGDSPQSAIGNRQSKILLRVPFIQNQGQIADPQVLFYARTFGGTVYVTAEGALVYALPRLDDGTSNAECRMQNAECSEGGGQATDDRRQTPDARHQSGKDKGGTTGDVLQSKIGNRKSEIPQIGPQSALHNPAQRGTSPQLAPPKAGSAILLIRETLVDADLIAAPSGTERSGAVINSFIGNDPRRWQANIPAFTGVQFGDIYEGIALEVRATGDNVEKIFTVAPGADPARIALRLAGADGVRITPEGELEARTALGPVRFTAPVAYQRSAAGERQSVSVAYALEGDQVGFCVGAFDAARPLVIDPLLASTFIGGTSTNVIRAMALDSQTNVLVAGWTTSTDFPTNNCTDYKGVPPDGFIAKFDPQLTNLLAATYLGGSGEDAIMAMAINTNNGAVYVAGYTASTDFPRQAALYNNYGGGDYDAFVSVFDGNLSALTVSTYLGGTNIDMAYALALSAGPTPDVFVAGLTSSTNFPITNTWTTSFRTNLSRATGSLTNDAFVVRFNTDLAANLASTYLGGTNDDGAYGIALDTNDFVYVTGYTSSTNFPMTNGAVRRYCGGIRDAFVSRLPVKLTNLNASTFLGGTNNDCANGIAVAPFTNIVCVAGYTYSTNFTQNPSNDIIALGYTNRYRGGKDAFLTRLDLALTNVRASTYIGGTNDDEATAVLAAATTNTPLRIYVAGWTTSTNFPVTPNACDTTANGGRDAFISCFGASNTLQASTYLGGSTNDSAYAMALQADRFSLFVAGETASTNFPATLRAYDNDRTGQANDDGFVTKLGSGLAYGSKKWQVVLWDLGDTAATAGSPSLGWDGNVYCGFGSNLCAFDAQGVQRWRVKAAGKLVSSDAGVVYGLGSTPAVSTNGTIYITTSGSNTLQAISPAGGVQWTFSADDKAYYSSPAIGSDGTIYFGTFGGSFYAVRTNGAGLWTNSLGGTIYASPAIAANGNIFVANALVSPNGLLKSFTTNGSVSDTWNLPGSTYSSPTFGPTGRVYIGSGSKLYAFDPGNTITQQIWNAANQIYASPTVDSNGVIYVSGGTNFYAFNADGTTNRSWGLGGVMKSSATVDTNGNVIVGAGSPGGNYYLYSFNPANGATNWALELDEQIDYHSPLIQRDGTIYMVDDYNIYAVFAPAAAAKTNWPTARHDVLRTGNAAFDAAPLLKPAGLTVFRGAYLDRVVVSWIGDPNADYYELFRSQTNDVAAASLIRTLTATNYTDFVGASSTNIEPGMIYYYWVRVATPVDMSVFSDYASGGVPPLPPTGVVASKGEAPYTNEIFIAWNPSTNATTYYLYHSMTNATNTAALLTTTNITGFTNTAIDRGLTNFYWVQAGNAEAGISGFSDGDYGGTPPLPPTNVTAGYGVAYQAVDVAWSASTGTAMYAVYRNISNGIPGSAIVTNIGGLTFGDSNTVAYTHYFYWVRATNRFGAGEFTTNLAEGFRLMRPPQAIYATKGVYTNLIRVTWQFEVEPTSYLIYRSMTNDPAMAVYQFEVPYPSSTNYDDRDITRGACYYYWMKSKNADGTSVLSTAYDYGGTVPYAPLNVSAGDGTDETRVLVTWTAANYATAYEVYRQETYAPWSLTTPIGIVYGTDYYSDTGAGSGHIYYYWVKSTNQFGRSELSGFNTGWRTLASPYAVAASDGVSTGYVQATWSSSSTNSTYELWRGSSSDISAALMLVNAVSTTNYYDTDATPGALFYYWARAKTPQFVSEFSACDSGWRALGEVDIGVSDLVLLPTRMAVGGAPAAVSFRVANCGAQNMTAANTWVACNFYISSNSVYGADAAPMGGTTVSVPLTVGNSAVVVLPKAVRDSLAVPAVLPGQYYIYVNIQHALPSMWLDPNLINNTTNRNGGDGGRIQIGTNQPAGLLLVNDYNGDGYTDLAMYQESTGAWQIWLIGPAGVTAGITMSDRGGPDFQAVPADFDGDGKTDPAVYQEAAGTWKIWLSAGDYALADCSGWGGPGFEPVPADFDGDGLADPAVYQESTGTWQVWLSANGYSIVSAQGYGGTSWRPEPGDYDGDGRADPTVYQESTGTWRVWRSGAGYAPASSEGMGGAGYGPVLADYDGDGLMDPAVFQASTGAWWVWLSSSGYAVAGSQGMGNTGTVAVPGDFDGDGLTDPAVYWESFGLWRLWRSSTGYQQMEIMAWPGEGYQPAWR